jgi:hypothetical protein
MNPFSVRRFNFIGSHFKTVSPYYITIAALWRNLSTSTQFYVDFVDCYAHISAELQNSSQQLLLSLSGIQTPAAGAWNRLNKKTGQRLSVSQVGGQTMQIASPSAAN